MNISRPQQRTLHALAQGAFITPVRDERNRIINVECISREGWILSDCTLQVFQSLRRKGLIASQDSGPYRITRKGLANLRAQLDNRVTQRGWS